MSEVKSFSIYSLSTVPLYSIPVEGIAFALECDLDLVLNCQRGHLQLAAAVHMQCAISDFEIFFAGVSFGR